MGRTERPPTATHWGRLGRPDPTADPQSQLLCTDVTRPGRGVPRFIQCLCYDGRDPARLQLHHTGMVHHHSSLAHTPLHRI